MASGLSVEDRRVLDTFLEMALNEFRRGNLTRLEARDVIAEAFVQFALDDGNLVDYMEAMIRTRAEKGLKR